MEAKTKKWLIIGGITVVLATITSIVVGRANRKKKELSESNTVNSKKTSEPTPSSQPISKGSVDTESIKNFEDIKKNIRFDNVNNTSASKSDSVNDYQVYVTFFNNNKFTVSPLGEPDGYIFKGTYKKGGTEMYNDARPNNIKKGEAYDNFRALVKDYIVHDKIFN